MSEFSKDIPDNCKNCDNWEGAVDRTGSSTLAAYICRLGENNKRILNLPDDYCGVEAYDIQLESDRAAELTEVTELVVASTVSIGPEQIRVASMMPGMGNPEANKMDFDFRDPTTNMPIHPGNPILHDDL